MKCVGGLRGLAAPYESGFETAGERISKKLIKIRYGGYISSTGDSEPLGALQGERRTKSIPPALLGAVGGERKGDPRKLEMRRPIKWQKYPNRYNCQNVTN